MNEKKDLELFYILPYTNHINFGGNYYNDDKGCVDFRPGSVYVWKGSPLVFDKKEELLNWFIQNDGKPIPAVYRIKYIANYQGVDDVFKITNLKTGTTNYCTALSEKEYAWYKEDKSKRYNKIMWDYMYSNEYDKDKKFFVDYIYEEFTKRGIKIKFNVFKEDIDRKQHFDFVGDPFYYKNREKAKDKKLILYRYESSRCW